MPVPRKAAAKKAEPVEPSLPPVPPEVVVTVSGSHAVDGVAPGGRLPWDGDLYRLRGLMLAGHVTVTVGGDQISDGHIVARMEGA
jgi:hypothetical protein